jgi:hypothetical protein
LAWKAAKPWINRDGPANQFDRTRLVSLLMGHHSEQMQGVGVVGVGGEDSLIKLRRLLQSTALMILEGRVQVI